MGIAVKSSKIITLSGKVITVQRSTNVEHGYLYNFPAVVNTHGLAPDGWHISSSTERDTFISYLTNNGYGYGGSGSDTAKSMAAVSGWTDSATAGTPGNDQSSNNSSGFKGTASGYRTNSGSFMRIGLDGYWWCSTYPDSSNAHMYGLTYNSADPISTVSLKILGLSVRCIRDNDTGWSVGDKLFDIDGNIYDTVKIGNQIWTVQNLATTKYKDGTAIPLITDNTAWSADTTGARCAYNNDNSYVFL